MGRRDEERERRDAEIAREAQAGAREAQEARVAELVDENRRMARTVADLVERCGRVEAELRKAQESRRGVLDHEAARLESILELLSQVQPEAQRRIARYVLSRAHDQAGIPDLLGVRRGNGSVRAGEALRDLGLTSERAGEALRDLSADPRAWSRRGAEV
jgi:hypothetical protein